MHDVSVLIASHRPAMLGYALTSCYCQDGVSVQVLVNHSKNPENFHHAWNDLAAIATGRYFCILGDDDELGAGYLAAVVKMLDETGAAIGYTDVVGADRNRRGVVSITGKYVPPPQVGLKEMAQGNKIWQSSLVRAEAWRRVYGYAMELEYVHDWDFWVRVLEDGGKAVYVPGVSWTHYTHYLDRVTTTSNRERAFAAFWERHPELARLREPG